MYIEIDNCVYAYVFIYIYIQNIHIYIYIYISTILHMHNIHTGPATTLAVPVLRNPPCRGPNSAEISQQ